MTFVQLASVTLISAALATSAWGQTARELDITMSIVREDDNAAAVINRIELPPPNVSAALPQPSLAPLPETGLDTVVDDVQRATSQLLDNTTQTVTNTVTDVISTGKLDDLPKDITDKLPDIVDGMIPLPTDDLVDDLLDKPSDLLDQTKAIAPVDDISNALDDLESSPRNVVEGLDNTLTPALEPLTTPDAVLPKLPANQVEILKDITPTLDTVDPTLDPTLKSIEETTRTPVDDITKDLGL